MPVVGGAAAEARVATAPRRGRDAAADRPAPTGRSAGAASWEQAAIVLESGTEVREWGGRWLRGEGAEARAGAVSRGRVLLMRRALLRGEGEVGGRSCRC